MLLHLTVVAGCGGGDRIARALPRLLQACARLVLDADALNAIAADSTLAGLLAGRHLPTLLTPHPLEAGRLLGRPAADVQHDRMDAARSLAERFGCAVLLKGSGTLCAAPASRLVVNPTGNALLATAGTGDVLAGWAAGLWAQNTTSAALDVGAAAAWLHGHAADRAAQQGRRTALTASHLIDAMSEGLTSLDG